MGGSGGSSKSCQSLGLMSWRALWTKQHPNIAQTTPKQHPNNTQTIHKQYPNNTQTTPKQRPNNAQTTHKQQPNYSLTTHTNHTQTLTTHTHTNQHTHTNHTNHHHHNNPPLQPQQSPPTHPLARALSPFFLPFLRFPLSSKTKELQKSVS